MASAVGQQFLLGEPQRALNEALGDTSDIREAIGALTEERWPVDCYYERFSEAISQGDEEALDQILQEAERTGNTTALLERYREKLREYCPRDLTPDDEDCKKIARLATRFRATRKVENPLDKLADICSEANELGQWVESYLLRSFFYNPYILASDEDELTEREWSIARLLLEKLKGCISTSPKQFDLEGFVFQTGSYRRMYKGSDIDDEIVDVGRQAISLMLDYQKNTKGGA